MEIVLCKAVVDWNPSGVNIFCVYKFGSTARPGAAQFAVPELEWLAARAGSLHGVPDYVLQV
jgi:DNA topoisomerase VI subunit A